MDQRLRAWTAADGALVLRALVIVVLVLVALLGGCTACTLVLLRPLTHARVHAQDLWSQVQACWNQGDLAGLHRLEQAPEDDAALDAACRSLGAIRSADATGTSYRSVNGDVTAAVAYHILATHGSTTIVLHLHQRAHTWIIDRIEVRDAEGASPQPHAGGPLSL